MLQQLFKPKSEVSFSIPPPHHAKRQIVKRYAQQYDIHTLVETGTYTGDMIQAIKGDFKHIYSIELGQDLHEKAKQKFAKYQHIHFFQGDSAQVLPEVLKHIHEPSIFWLDGHYSEGITAQGDKDTPIVEELEHIFNHAIKNHVILIDDARCFDGTHDYPKVSEILQRMMDVHPDWVFELRNDIIRIHPHI